MSKVREREITFAVPVSWSVPDLSGLLADGESVEVAEVDLNATYFDTDDLALHRLGVTLRRRTGGEDAGWHLKVPAGSARTEHGSRSRALRPPQTITRLVRGVLAGQHLREVATIQTHRRAHRLIGADPGISGSRVILEIADDTVHATGLGGEAHLDSWREIEIEVGPAGEEARLGQASGLLEEAGAESRGTTMKLSRVLPGSDRHSPEGPLTRQIAQYVTTQCRSILLGDIALRERVDARTVHQTRVAIRRLRSTIRVFAAAIDRDLARAASDPARSDDAPFDLADFDGCLRWLAGLLGPIRDGDVLERRLSEQIDQLPAEKVLGPVRQHIVETIAADRGAATTAWQRAENDSRYLTTMATLGRWLAQPPVRDTGDDGSSRLKKAKRKLRRRLTSADGRADPLHRARKAAKRLRYTGDLLNGTVTGAKKTAKKAKRIQTALGEHQDATVTASFLLRLGAQAGAEPGHNGFTYGLLMRQAEDHAAGIRAHLGSP